MTFRKLAQNVIEIVENKQAKDVVLPNLTKISPIADYFMIYSADFGLHMKSIAQALDKELKGKQVKQFNRRHFNNDFWILLDYGSLAVHIFSQSTREYYRLERLRADAGRIWEGA